MPDYLRSRFASGLLALAALALVMPLPAVSGAACTGTLGCKNCQNCSHCVHCGKQGGICGACLHGRPAASKNGSPARSAGLTRPSGPQPVPASLRALLSPKASGRSTGGVPTRPDRPGRTAFDFRNRVLTGQKFHNLDLRGTDFSGANLRGVEFQGANLEKARFQGAFMGGANFTDCRLKNADLKGAWYDANTRWPDGFDPNAAGARPIE